MADKKFTKEDCVVLLQRKYAELQASGLERYPQRGDFSEREVVAIKAFLGPWPRALEQAGVKPPRDDGHERKTQEKRIRAKRRRVQAKKQGGNTQPTT